MIYLYPISKSFLPRGWEINYGPIAGYRNHPQESQINKKPALQI
jgi:hypothetical protein